VTQKTFRSIVWGGAVAFSRSFRAARRRIFGKADLVAMGPLKPLQRHKARHLAEVKTKEKALVVGQGRAERGKNNHPSTPQSAPPSVRFASICGTCDEKKERLRLDCQQHMNKRPGLFTRRLEPQKGKWSILLHLTRPGRAALN